MWTVYMIECLDGTLYTGITKDVARRFNEHSNGKRGARFLRGKGLYGVVYVEKCCDKGAALRRESSIKKLNKVQKISLKQSVIRIF